MPKRIPSWLDRKPHCLPRLYRKTPWLDLAGLQTTVPKIAPIPAVNAIASAPQKVTRSVALPTFAPPARAPIAPNRARKTSDPIETPATRAAGDMSKTIARGIAAPTATLNADVSDRARGCHSSCPAPSAVSTEVLARRSLTLLFEPRPFFASMYSGHAGPVMDDDIQQRRMDFNPFNPPSYSMKPSLRNLFMKKLIRERVVPTLAAKISLLMVGIIAPIFPSLPKLARSRRSRARRRSLELNNWSTRSAMGPVYLRQPTYPAGTSLSEKCQFRTFDTGFLLRQRRRRVRCRKHTPRMSIGKRMTERSWTSMLDEFAAILTGRAGS